MVQPLAEEIWFLGFVMALFYFIFYRGNGIFVFMAGIAQSTQKKNAKSTTFIIFTLNKNHLPKLTMGKWLVGTAFVRCSQLEIGRAHV